MKWISKLGKAISFVPKAIDAKVEEQIADKVKVGVVAVLQQVDLGLPIVTALLSGGQVDVEIKATIRLVEKVEPDFTGEGHLGVEKR